MYRGRKIIHPCFSQKIIKIEMIIWLIHCYVPMSLGPCFPYLVLCLSLTWMQFHMTFRIQPCHIWGHKVHNNLGATWKNKSISFPPSRPDDLADNTEGQECPHKMLLKSRLLKKQKYQSLYTCLGPLIIVKFLKRKVISRLLSNNMHLLKMQ